MILLCQLDMLICVNQRIKKILFRRKGIKNIVSQLIRKIRLAVLLRIVIKTKSPVEV
jgi:hypothetical protein